MKTLCYVLQHVYTRAGFLCFLWYPKRIHWYILNIPVNCSLILHMSHLRLFPLLLNIGGAYVSSHEMRIIRWWTFFYFNLVNILWDIENPDKWLTQTLMRKTPWMLRIHNTVNRVNFSSCSTEPVPPEPNWLLLYRAISKNPGYEELIDQ